MCVVKCDVTNDEDLKKAVSTCISSFGTFDCQINNAGISELPFVFETDEDISKWRKVVDINLTAVVRGTQLAIHAFKKQGKGGVVVNIASMGGLLPMKGSLHIQTNHLC